MRSKVPLTRSHRTESGNRKPRRRAAWSAARVVAGTSDRRGDRHVRSERTEGPHSISPVASASVYRTYSTEAGGSSIRSLVYTASPLRGSGGATGAKSRQRRSAPRRASARLASRLVSHVGCDASRDGRRCSKVAIAASESVRRVKVLEPTTNQNHYARTYVERRHAMRDDDERDVSL